MCRMNKKSPKIVWKVCTYIMYALSYICIGTEQITIITKNWNRYIYYL